MRSWCQIYAGNVVQHVLDLLTARCVPTPLKLLPILRREVAKNASNGELKEDDLRGIFKEFDLNGDGYIQKDELNAVMLKMGQCPTDDELNAMFSAADKDRDGNIDFSGICYSLSVLMSVASFLRLTYTNISICFYSMFDVRR
ncbi:unnamed protein product [Gongylonema pulchrum]|uniref:EF-hand domain-containing protein n=1 Tax=Gongylonema pulchrum TaxID=637853 RepID=A0A183E0D7_9BILA|nr:unnamed protein product [Gongylonema pulchrum]